VIEQAYVGAEAAGVAVWCQDEAGPFQTVPQAGQSWEPVGKARCQPHEYERNGTAKLLTFFHPATGQVRAQGVPSAPNAVLHPWLHAELEQVLAELPAVTTPEAERLPLARWETWLGRPPRTVLPALRLILIWDNRAGHLTPEMVLWLYHHGVLPLYTPLSGSWLNRAESLQRILKRRALDGQHPQTVEEIITDLEETVAGWNAAPTPFHWHGKRYARRQRARLRRHQRLAGSGAACSLPSSITR
jgi:DDE superfamily endonuclease